MSLHLILGETQKEASARLREELIASSLKYPEKRHIILVPEQFSLQTQRDVVAAHPRHAVLNIDIVTFDRLSYRVLEEAGENRQILTEVGKNMLLRRAAGQHEKEMVLYRRSLKKPGFINRLMAMLSEFAQYGVSREELSALPEKLKDYPRLAAKIRELALFYDALHDMMGQKQILAEELLPLCRERLAESGFFRDAVVALDHFTGFTPVQRSILSITMKQAEQVSAAFLLPEREDRGEEIRPGELFAMSRMAAMQLSRMAAEAGAPATREYCSGEGKEEKASELLFLGEHYLRYGKKRAVYPETPEAIRFTLARNPREEARLAARRIRRMVREEGVRYREIAVAVGDMEVYRPALLQEFARTGIPFFCDRKRGVLGNPLVEYLRSAMEILEKDFSYESVMRHLRTGLTGIPAEEIDRLDLYISQAGIRGKKRWQETWDWNPDPSKEPDFEKMNALRQAVLADLAPWMEAAGKSVRDRTRALRAMLENAGAAEKMEERAEACLASGRGDLAQEFRRIYEFLLELLDQMDALLGDEKPGREEFSDILEAGLEGARLGLLPTGLDSVQIGDVRRSRLTDIRVLFVLGMNDGVIPAPAAEGGILTEWERSLLAACRIELAPDAEASAMEERFYLYMLFSRPSGNLFLSASRMSRGGTSLRISPLIHSLLQCFPKLQPEDENGQKWQETLEGADAAWMIFSENVRPESDSLAAGRPEPDFMDLVRELRSREGERLERIIDRSFRSYRGEKLSPEISGALYGKELTGSVTRLENFALCAARHFFSYGLRLSERRYFEITAAGRGSFFHRIMEEFFRLFREKNIPLAELGEEDRKKLVHRALDAAAAEESVSRIAQSSAFGQALYERWEQVADQSLWILCEQLKEGDFLPEAFEMSFTGWQNSALSVEPQPGTRLVLGGKIDRVDSCETEGRRYVRVIDYKTGRKSFDLGEVWQGLSLQLLLYLDAVLELEERRWPDKDVVPAGAAYQTLREIVAEAKPGDGDQEIRKIRLKEARPRGIFNGAQEVSEHQGPVVGTALPPDQLRGLVRHTREKVAEYGRQILEGDISALPVRQDGGTACETCPYADVCGFDRKVEGYEYRKIPRMSAEAVLEALKKEEGRDEVDR